MDGRCAARYSVVTRVGRFMKLREFIFRASSIVIVAVTVFVNIHFIKATIVHFVQTARSSQSLMMLILGAGLIALTCVGFAIGRNAKGVPENVSAQVDALTEQDFNGLLALESRRAGSQPVALAGRASDLRQAQAVDRSGFSEMVSSKVGVAGRYGRSRDAVSIAAGVHAKQGDASGKVAAAGAASAKVIISISEGAHPAAASNEAVEERRTEELAVAGGERGAKPPVSKGAKAFACSSEAVG